MALDIERIREIAEVFGIRGEYRSCHPITDGNINHTYKLRYKEDGENKYYLLQGINTFVFKNPDELMDNIVRVTDFLAEKYEAAGLDASRHTLRFLKSNEGKYYYTDSEGKCWRICNFVSASHSYNTIDSPETYKKAGVAFGEFNTLLADFPGETLYETIPHFHDTRKRFADLRAAVERNASGRLCDVEPEVMWALSKEKDACTLVEMTENGELPIRVTHNDTKLNNILFDDDTNEAICIIDLDTVMPGLSLYDFGDSVRYAANTAEEDETDLSKVDINLKLYKAYVDGFLAGAGKNLTKNEVELLPFSAKIMAYECGIRFLADFLEGDTYFKTLYPNHNLDRCRCQFKMFRAIEARMPEMLEITLESYANIVNDG